MSTTKARDIADIDVDKLLIIPPEATSGQLPVINDLRTGVDWINFGQSVQSTINTDYTVVNSDFIFGTELKKVDSATLVTITVPLNLTPLDMCTFVQIGLGQMVFAPAPGVTIISADNFLKSRVQGCFLSLIPDSDVANQYMLVGGLTV